LDDRWSFFLSHTPYGFVSVYSRVSFRSRLGCQIKVREDFAGMKVGFRLSDTPRIPHLVTTTDSNSFPSSFKIKTDSNHRFKSPMMVSSKQLESNLILFRAKTGPLDYCLYNVVKVGKPNEGAHRWTILQ
jgi:hypothetical protein